MGRLDVGDMVRLEARFADWEGAPADPASVVLRVKKPSGAVILPTVSRAATGYYYAEVLLDEAGWWQYQWESTGTPTAVEGGEFHVLAKRIE